MNFVDSPPGHRGSGSETLPALPQIPGTDRRQKEWEEP